MQLTGQWMHACMGKMTCCGKEALGRPTCVQICGMCAQVPGAGAMLRADVPLQEVPRPGGGSPAGGADSAEHGLHGLRPPPALWRCASVAMLPLNDPLPGLGWSLAGQLSYLMLKGPCNPLFATAASGVTSKARGLPTLDFLQRFQQRHTCSGLAW